MNTQKGFTLIELIIVIVVLGILAVTAAPQFINFSSDARESTLKGLQASMKSAVELSYAKAAIDGKLAGENTVPTNSSTVVIAIANGYPKAAAIATAAGAGSDWTFAEKTAGDYAGGTNGVYVGTLASLAAAGSTATEIEATNCYITYEDNADDTGKPLPVATVSGC
ncbi:type II secretion system protein [Pseudidiomarina terrestris]|uniref:Type II secretion system protein n=1 Tax=Pseudidiomarina terrestris TaxID=2820060 RepID=A0AAW7QWK9_9GAMM|nr:MULTISPECIES: type II secretion system protein [unclassified Pseudidiomarina]MDN7124273.1 type II secretion system protein [Pseudidiomarina sp. 1APP75-32.1]MDN7129436.1 type II secretion system protein [Pseudidiomarina sp. 1APR75-15]MDN7134299.1 type II secretion system protein [Pseudidiomarina sp. 1ASP75-5]MDN7137013.1 type II secretion system protein [Pseudidiomarina sp. 1ASP75-14]MEA3587907.1 type II secretion system protein [Pseudidiomarina sp. 1APP75-27a]